MVKGVKCLGTELESRVFTAKPGEFKILEHTKICIVSARPCQDVPSQISKHPWLSIGVKLAHQRLCNHSRIKPGGCGPELRIIRGPFYNLQIPYGIASRACSDPSAEPADATVEINRVARGKGRNPT